MKNTKLMSFAVAAALAASLGLAACGDTQAPAQSASAPAATESAAKQAPATESNTQEAPPATDSAATQAPAATQETSAPAASSSTSSAASYIGDQAAIDIALSNAGLTANDVFELEVELDLDDPTVHYDVNFKQGTTEYDYDIDATTGAILFSNTEIDD